MSMTVTRWVAAVIRLGAYLSCLTASVALAQPPVVTAPQAQSTDSLPPGATGNFNFGQQGGTTNQTYINQAPPPSLHIDGESDWSIAPEGVKKTIELRAYNAGDMAGATITVHGAGLVRAGAFGVASPMWAVGDANHGDGWVSIDVKTLSTLRGIEVYAEHPTALQLDAKGD